jgi:hypothetical protein
VFLPLAEYQPEACLPEVYPLEVCQPVVFLLEVFLLAAFRPQREACL